MTTSTTIRIHTEGGALVPEQVAVEVPSDGWVRVRVHASGICGADVRTALASEARGPVTPGHEVAGVVEELGRDVEGWSLGERVSVGWFGGSCGTCSACLAGDVVHCPARKVPGISYAGGWAETITVPAHALARIPDGMTFEQAAPMGCAGVTVFNALKTVPLLPGSPVAVFGIGGLGHLAVQYAAALGYEVTAIARGAERAQSARTLGASAFIDSAVHEPGRALSDRGGVAHIISTSSSTAPIAELLRGLRPHGTLTVIGADAGAISIPAGQLVMNALSIRGHLTGSPRDIETVMRFAQDTNAHPRIEVLRLEEAAEGLRRVRDGEARFRVVLNASETR